MYCRREIVVALSFCLCSVSNGQESGQQFKESKSVLQAKSVIESRQPKSVLENRSAQPSVQTRTNQIDKNSVNQASKLPQIQRNVFRPNIESTSSPKVVGKQTATNRPTLGPQTQTAYPVQNIAMTTRNTQATYFAPVVGMDRSNVEPVKSRKTSKKTDDKKSKNRTEAVDKQRFTRIKKQRSRDDSDGVSSKRQRTFRAKRRTRRIR